MQCVVCVMSRFQFGDSLEILRLTSIIFGQNHTPVEQINRKCIVKKNSFLYYLLSFSCHNFAFKVAHVREDLTSTV